MFPEGGDADATAAYVSMYQECVKGWWCMCSCSCL